MKFNFKTLIPIVIAGGMAVFQEISNQKKEEEFEEMKQRLDALESEEEES